MMAKQLQTYQDNAVTTASGPQLTMMLYNGCIKFTNQAKKALEQDDFEKKNHYIQRAQDIVQELMLTLDQSIELSSQMLPLYEYIYHQLQQAIIQHEMEYLDEALLYMTTFRDTWKEVMLRSVRSVQEEKV